MARASRKAVLAAADEVRVGQVQSVTRALAIMRGLAESGDGMMLSDVAQIVGLAPSTAHRLLTTLQQERFVRFDATAHLWQVGVEAFIIGNAFVRTRDVVTMARPYLRRLMEEGGETANLYLEQDGEAICMAQVECRQMMRAIARPGGRVKMHCSGAGKAMLGWMPEAEIGRIVRQHGLRRFTPDSPDGLAFGQSRASISAGRPGSYAGSGSPVLRDATGERGDSQYGQRFRGLRACRTDPNGESGFTDRTLDTPSRLRRDLELVRERGYAVDDEEHAIGLRCVAATVFDEHGQPVAALSLSGPGARVDEHRLQELGRLTARIAGEFYGELGGHSASRPPSE